MTTAENIPVPTGWRVLIKKYTAKSVTAGGIALPDEIVKNQDYVGNVGEIIAMGPSVFKNDKFEGEPPWCEVGDTIFFNPHAGIDIKVRQNDAVVTYRVINDDEVIASIGDPSVVVRNDI